MAMPGTPVSNISTADEIIYADITKPHTLEGLCKGITHVIHLAALASDWGPLPAFLKVNAEGTKNMLEASLASGIKRFLFVSSLAIHPLNGHNGSDENAPAASTINPYAISKKSAESIVKYFDEKIETVIVRPGFFPYGPGDTTSFIHLAQAIMSGKYANINGGKSMISTSYIENLTEGMTIAALHPKASRETFILCDNEPVSWNQIAADISSGLGKKQNFISIPFKLAYAVAMISELLYRAIGKKTAPPITRYRVSVPRKNLVFSNKKARELIGYNPKITWADGLKKTLDWYTEYLGRNR